MAQRNLNLCSILIVVFILAITPETFAKTFLGAVVGHHPEEQVDSEGMYLRGAYVVNVLDGTPASKAGIKPGDLIVRFGEEPIESFSELVRFVQASKVGRQVRLKVIRELNQPPLDIDVKLGTAPDVQPALLRKTIDTTTTHYTYTDTVSFHIESPWIDVSTPVSHTWIQRDGSDIIISVNKREIRIPKVGSKLQEFNNQPLPESENELLQRLDLSQMPLTPFGGRWTYIKSPGHNTFTLHAFDTHGVLKFTYHSSPITQSVFYDVLNTGQKIGRTRQNLLWTPPWDSCILGPIAAQALRDYTKADIGLFNAYGMRGNIPKGIIRKAHLEHVFVWPDSVQIVQLKGNDLLSVLARGLEKRWWLYTAGVTMEAKHVDLGIPEFTAKLDNGELIESEKIYSVAVSSFLANAGDGFFPFKNALHRKRMDLGILPIMEEYFRKKF